MTSAGAPPDDEELPAPPVPPPPEEPELLLAWADRHNVRARLDDLLIGGVGAPAGTSLPGRDGEALTYRQILIARGGGGVAPSRSRHHDAEDTARRFLHRIATLAAAQSRARAWLESHGREPDDPIRAALVVRLRIAVRALEAGGQSVTRADGTYQPVRVWVARLPQPLLHYEERPLVAAAATPPDADRLPAESTALLLLGWNEGPPRWASYRGERALPGEVSVDRQQAALVAIIDWLRDPRAAAEQERLGELLRLPAWQYALGALDESLSRLEAGAGRAGGGGDRQEGAGDPVGQRVAFRVTARGADGALEVEPLIQKRAAGGGFSKGSRLPWFQLAERRDLTPIDRLVFRAYDDRFARRSNAWGGPLTPEQTFGILRALIDHPAVFMEGQRAGARLDIRQGRLQLRFATAAGGSTLTPQFELLGVTMLASEAAQALRDDRHLMYLHRVDGARLAERSPSREGPGTLPGFPADRSAEAEPQVLLAQLGPQAAAVVRALALAPAQFPPEAHDALAARLESLQETMDIELPSQWTRTIAPADGRVLAQLALLASGALHLRLGVRPVRQGPVFAPGEGPALVLEGHGRLRHGARRERAAERQAGHGLAERLGLGDEEERDPWCWRVRAGDPALHLVATLQALAERDEVAVEWADDERWLALGSVGRGQMRMKVADRRDWFAIEGGAEVARRPGVKGKPEVVPLAELLAAIREGRRYVAVGKRGFVRIEESLREALARADAMVFESHGSLQLAAVAAMAHDPLTGLVEREAQIEASDAFSSLRRRMREAASGEADVARCTETMDGVLRPYQKAGAGWMARLAHWGAGAILADEMGLGKTVQTLSVLIGRAALGPALVVAPTSVVANWVGEAARFAPELRVRLYRGPEREAALAGLGPGDLVVTSYAVATLDAQALARITFASLVLDEAQAVKNATTERAKALRELDAAWRVGLTGTPIENHLGELWSLLRVISPGLLGSWEQFRARYSVPIEKFGDDRRRRALAALLRPFVLRRTKAEVARELPARTEIVRMIRLSSEEKALYEELRHATLEALALAKRERDRDARDMRFVLLAALTRLRQLCCHPRLVYPRTQAGSSKAAHLLDLMGELREGGHKALVFSQFRSFLELLAPRLRQHGFRVLVLDGTTPVEVREQRIAAFQAGDGDAFLISLKAGGFGLNLTAADTVIHLDPWWNPAVEDQATARAHRIGQQRPVTAVRLVARGTIEEAVLGLHAAKRALAAGVLEGTDLAASLATEDLVALIAGGRAGPV